MIVVLKGSKDSSKSMIFASLRPQTVASEHIFALVLGLFPLGTVRGLRLLSDKQLNTYYAVVGV